MRADVIRRFAVPAGRVRSRPNGIDVDPLATPAGPPRRPDRRRRRPVIVFAGRLVHEKGLQDLIDALPAGTRRHPGARLVVAGTGVLVADLRAQARTRRVARAVQWAGFLPEEQLVDLLGGADVVVVPSLYEPFGLVALEAAAAGHAAGRDRDRGSARPGARRAWPAPPFAPGDAAAPRRARSRGVLDDPAPGRRGPGGPVAERVRTPTSAWAAAAAPTTRRSTRQVPEPS